MHRLLPLVLKTLWRHRTRTLLTASGAAVALFVYCVVGSVQDGLSHLGSREQARRSLVVFQANKFCPATSHLPQDYDRQIAKFAGVQRVVPIQVYTNNCRASLDVVVFYGLPARELRGIRNFQLSSGNWSDFEGHQDAAVVGAAVAQRRKIRTGDKFSIGGYSVQVAGIFTADDPAEENYIYTHLDFLQRGSRNLVGTVTQFEVQLGPEADTTAVCEAIDERFRGGPVETDSRAKGAFQAKSLGDLTELIRLSYYLSYACVAMVLALVGTTTLMAVQDRIREQAVMQAIGFSASRVFGMVVLESTLLSLLGGLVGVACAMALLASTRLAIGAEAVTIAFVPSFALAGAGILTALAVGVLAGLAPAWQAVRTDLATSLREA